MNFAQRLATLLLVAVLCMYAGYRTGYQINNVQQLGEENKRLHSQQEMLHKEILDSAAHKEALSRRLNKLQTASFSSNQELSNALQKPNPIVPAERLDPNCLNEGQVFSGNAFLRNDLASLLQYARLEPSGVGDSERADAEVSDAASAVSFTTLITSDLDTTQRYYKLAAQHDALIDMLMQQTTCKLLIQ